MALIEQTYELFINVWWDPNPDIGKKFCLIMPFSGSHDRVQPSSTSTPFLVMICIRQHLQCAIA